MIKVYGPKPSAHIVAYYDWFGFESTEFERSTDIEEVLAQDIKIACVPVFFNELGDDALKFDYQKFDLLLISDIEINGTPAINKWLERSNIKNYLVSLGSVTFDSKMTEDFIYRPFWAFNQINRNRDSYLELDSKEFLFDVLLGTKKPHRDWVMVKMIQNDLLNRSIVTYRDIFAKFPVTISQAGQDLLAEVLDTQIPYPYVSPNLNPLWEVSETMDNTVSELIPWSIYEQTRYSIVTESHADKRGFFFTEKSSKAILGRRVFVVFSGHNFLKNMKELMGFRTFDNLIDESYDSEPNVSIRFNMAFEQVKKLAEMDFREVQAATKEVREHNHKRMFELKAEKNSLMLEKIYNKLGLKNKE